MKTVVTRARARASGTVRVSRPPARVAKAVPLDPAEQRILDAAHRVFLRAGTAGARTQEIAREAGVNSALLHYYFRSKEQLAAAVFRRAARDMMPAVLRVLASEVDLETKVAEVVRIEIEHLGRTPGLPGYILSELNHHAERTPQFMEALIGHAPSEMGNRIRRTLGRQLRAAARGRRITPIAVEQFVVNLVALCVFPFAARPLLCALLGLDDRAFAAFIDRRRTELPAFFLRALRP